MSYAVATFYKFVALPDCETLRSQILDHCQQNNIYGSILLAQEGINGTVCSDRIHLTAFIEFLRQDPRLCDLTTKESESDRAQIGRAHV